MIPEPKGGPLGQAAHGGSEPGEGTVKGWGSRPGVLERSEESARPPVAAEASSPASEVLRPQCFAANVSPLPRSPPKVCTFL